MGLTMWFSLVDDYRGVRNGSQAVVIPARKTFTESDNWGIGAKPAVMSAFGTKQTFQPMWIYVCFRG
jgi:hypothetical protein